MYIYMNNFQNYLCSVKDTLNIIGSLNTFMQYVWYRFIHEL